MQWMYSLCSTHCAHGTFHRKITHIAVASSVQGHDGHQIAKSKKLNVMITHIT